MSSYSVNGGNLMYVVVGTVLLVAVVFAGERAARDEFHSIAQQLSNRPDDELLGNRLRKLCRDQKTVDRCINFFEQLAERFPNHRSVRYNAALTQVDSIPGRSTVAQALRATRAIEHASAVLKQDPNDWTALYIRGLANLYWPRWFGRAGRAIMDLDRCAQISAALPAPEREPYMVLAYVALGDAFVKSGQIEDAQRVWRLGTSYHPSGQLTLRLAKPEVELQELIEAIRSPDVPVDTDLLMLTPRAELSRL